MFGRAWPIASSSAATCSTIRLRAGERLQRVDERLEVGEGKPGNVLLVFDKSLLPGDGVQFFRELGFDTTRRNERDMRPPSHGKGIDAGWIGRRVLKQHGRGHPEELGDLVKEVEANPTFAGEHLRDPRARPSEVFGEVGLAGSEALEAGQDVEAESVSRAHTTITRSAVHPVYTLTRCCGQKKSVGPVFIEGTAPQGRQGG